MRRGSRTEEEFSLTPHDLWFAGARELDCVDPGGCLAHDLDVVLEDHF